MRRPNLKLAKTVQVESLPFVLAREKSRLPVCTAVYFVLRGPAVLYIGASTNLRQRLNSFHEQAHKLERDDRIAWHVVADNRAALARLELGLIRLLKPEWNVMGLPGRMAERMRECAQIRSCGTARFTSTDYVFI